MSFIWNVKWNNIFHKENNLIFILRVNCYVTPIIWQTNKPVCWWVGPPKQDDVGWLSIFFSVFFLFDLGGICMQSRALTRLMVHGLHHQINTKKKYMHMKNICEEYRLQLQIHERSYKFTTRVYVFLLLFIFFNSLVVLFSVQINVSKLKFKKEKKPKFLKIWIFPR